MERASIDLYDFSDYRDFFQAYIKAEKKKNPNWTVQTWAYTMGMTNMTFLNFILKGQRLPGKKGTAQFVKYFKWNEEDKEYFKLLVEKEKSKSITMQPLFLKQINTLKKERSVEKKILNDKKVEQLRHWTIYAIQQMARMGPLKKDAKWIQSKLLFSVPLRTIKNTIADLKSLGFLREEDDKLVADVTSFGTQNDISVKNIRQLHAQFLKLAGESIHKVPMDQRELQAGTILLSKKNYLKARTFIREFMKEFISNVDEENGQVYQLNLQFFPLSHCDE